jgi:hypothetical protein
VKTDDLIKALAADTPMQQWRMAPVFAAALLVGLVVALAIFQLRLGVRANAYESLGTVRFPFKFVVTLALTLPALVAVYRLTRPEGELGRLGLALLAAPVLLAVAVALELVNVPPELWRTRLVGQNSAPCVYLIPLMAIGPLAAMIGVLRYGAVTQPRLAALAAGLAAAGLAATLYAAHCPDDSPLFVATWYTVATAIVVTASLLVAPRLLRW